MATIPARRTLTAKSLDILNAIRNGASVNYRDYVPEATDEDSLRTIGNIVMNYSALQNEFLSALVNRITRVIITSKLYDNPWSVFKRGMLTVGETTEEIFANIAKPYEYDMEKAETEVFKRRFPDVRTAFYTMNYQKFYPVTISRAELMRAFTSLDGVTDLIARIVDSLYTAANYDEFLTMKYMLARYILDGRMKPISIDGVGAANAAATVTSIKGASNKMEFLSSSWNAAGVYNYTRKPDQYLVLDSEFDAVMDVNVLAGAFNETRAEFMGRRILVDSFGDLDKERLALLFADDPNYKAITDEEMAALATIPAVLVDRDFWMVYDNMSDFTENFNGQGDYWNYFYHQWKTFAISPFAQAAIFVVGDMSVDGITATPSSLSITKGGSASIGVEVDVTGFAPKTVTFTSNRKDVTVDALGVVSVATDATSTSATITITSTFDEDVSETVSVSVS